MPDDFEALRVVDLKEECKKRGLLVGGKKQELIDRLNEFEANKAETKGEQSEKTTEPETSLEPAAPQEVDAAAEEIVQADAAPDQGAADMAVDAAPQVQAHAEPTKADGISAQAAPATAAGTDTQAAKEAVEDASYKAGTGASLAGEAAGPVLSSSTKPDVHKAKAAAKQAEAAAESQKAAASPMPVLEAEMPAVEAPAATPAAAKPLVPASQMPSATIAAPSQPRADETAADNAAEEHAMEVDPATAGIPPAIAEVQTAKVAEPRSADVTMQEASAAASPEVTVTAAAADAGTVSAAAAADTQKEQHPAAAGEEPAAPAAKQDRRAGKDATPADKGRSQRADPAEPVAHATARKRGREGDESAQQDRKAPRTEQKGDASAAHRDRDRDRGRDRDADRGRDRDADRERDKDRQRDRDRQKERESERNREKEAQKSQANGNAPSERKRRHVPISYKPPEKQPSGADPSQSDAAKRGSRLDKKVSGAEQADALPTAGSGLESRPSDLARNVSTTESGQKLSVFERLQRGRGEGSGSQTLPASREGSAPAPVTTRPTEATPQPLPRTSSHSRRSQPTRALKIEGFVRPFTEAAAQAMLSETGEISSMWMPKIKTHAFVIYATQGQAEATLKATHNLNWPAGNPSSKLLTKHVPVEEAEAAIARALGGGPPGAPALPSAAPNGLPPLKESASTQEAHARPEARDAGHASRARGRTDLDEPRRSRDALDDRRRPREDDRRRVKEEILYRAPEAVPEPIVAEAPPPTLDDLFRKTTTKPPLYWLPLTEAQATKRKAEQEAAAAEKAKAEDLPAPPEPMAVS